MILTLVFLVLAVLCYAIKELHAHSKLKWSKGDDSFWGEESYWRKYASPIDPPVDNWYYRLFKIGYREKWPTSATLTVAFTDGYHHMQFWFFNFLSLSLTFAIGFNWWLLLVIWSLIHVVHIVTYRLLQRTDALT